MVARRVVVSGLGPVVRPFFVPLFVPLLVPLFPWSAAYAQGLSQGGYDFAYRVSGDRRVAPVQVFDDGQSTYIQFKTGQTVPAIFMAGEGGEQLASAVTRGGYVVLAGTASEWVMRIGSVVSAAQYEGDARGRRGGAGRAVQVGGIDLMEEPAWGPAVSALPATPQRGGGGAPSGQRVAAPRASVGGMAQPSPQGSSYSQAGYSPAGYSQAGYSQAAYPTGAYSQTYAASPPPGALPARPSMSFDASTADPNMRAVLTRWAKLAGWSFDAQHWTVDVDIPLAGAASFGADFKSAVRDLLGSTELSSRPLQPCFYSNQVLRVVPLAEACNRAANVASAR